MRVNVWDRVVRFFHWSTALLFLSNYWVIEDGSDLHEWVGYALAALLLVRIVWGFIGSQNARFINFFPTPKRLTRYLQQLRSGKRPTEHGHNPIGSLMIFTLMTLMFTLCISGWLTTLDMFWGVDWPEELHELVGNAIMSLVTVHVAVVLISDFKYRNQLLSAMIRGWKDAE